MFYPDNAFKSYWDILITVYVYTTFTHSLFAYRLIFITCIMTPYSMAFQNDNFNLGNTIFDSMMNLTFLVDITIQFCSAFYDLDFNIIDDRKVNKVKIT
jgi:hypothetical protein